MALPAEGELSIEDISREQGNGRLATFVDGVMRWVDKDGKPGERVTGDFDFIQRGNTYTLFPAEDRPTSRAARQKRAVEEQQKPERYNQESPSVLQSPDNSQRCPCWR